MAKRKPNDDSKTPAKSQPVVRRCWIQMMYENEEQHLNDIDVLPRCFWLVVNDEAVLEVSPGSLPWDRMRLKLSRFVSGRQKAHNPEELRTVLFDHSESGCIREMTRILNAIRDRLLRFHSDRIGWMPRLNGIRGFGEAQRKSMGIQNHDHRRVVIDDPVIRYAMHDLDSWSPSLINKRLKELIRCESA